jgi:DNA-binding HxlR family transcriptional regulator
MTLRRSKDVDSERCPVRGVLDRLSDRWTVLVLLTLDDYGTMRFTTLKTRIPDVSPRMLAQTLRRLEQYGLVARTVYPTIPPKVEYALTPLGRSFLPPLRGLVSWARRNREKVRTARASYQPPPKQQAL